MSRILRAFKSTSTTSHTSEAAFADRVIEVIDELDCIDNNAIGLDCRDSRSELCCVDCNFNDSLCAALRVV